MGDRRRDPDAEGGHRKAHKRRRAPVGGAGDLPAPINTEESLDEKETATLVDLGDETAVADQMSGEAAEEISSERTLGEMVASTEVAARTDQSSIDGSGSWIGSDTQEVSVQEFDEASEESAQTQSISEALTGEVSSSYEGSITGSGGLVDSDGWPEGPTGEQRTPSGLLDGPDDLAGFDPGGPRETPPASTTSYDFNEEASGDMLGIILEETREFPELDPDNLPDPTGPLFSSEERTGDTSQEIDELLGAEVSAAVRMGVKSLRRGQRQEAMKAFEKALRGDPDDPMAQAYLRLAQELYIRELVPGASLDSVPQLRVGRKMLMTLDLTPEDGAVLALIDGATSLEELETMLAHMDRDTIYGCLARAQENGHIEFLA